MSAGSEKVEKHATKFEAQFWTVIHDCERGEEYHQWAVIMLDGDDAGQVCAAGSEESMKKYAAQLNESNEVLA